MKTLRVLLGDQLSENITTLKDMAETDIILMAEVMDEASYAKHHKKKLALQFHPESILSEHGHDLLNNFLCRKAA